MTSDDRCESDSIMRRPLGGWRWFLLYCILSLVIQWPLVSSLTTHISYGYEQEIAVPLLNLWTVWWNADRAQHGFQAYFDSPIFFPTKQTFVFSESQPTSVVVAPLIWLTGNRVFGYNVYQLLIITLNGFSTHRLLSRLGHIPWIAFCGAVMSQILPFAMWQFGVVQLTTLFGIVWTLHAVLDLFRIGLPDHDDEPDAEAADERPSPLRAFGNVWIGIRLGTAFGVTYWSCNYWGLFLAMLLVPCSICFWNRMLFTAAFWRNIVVAACISAGMIGPIGWKQHSLSHQHDWHSARTDETTRGLSAYWRDHTDLPCYSWAWWLEFPEPDRENIWTLGGGGLKLLLAPIGLIAAVLNRKRRRWGLFTVAFGAMAFALSLGPAIQFINWIPIVGGICPFTILQKYVPGFSLIRSPFRMAMFVQLAAVWLTIEALDYLNPLRWMSSDSLKTEIRNWKLPWFVNPTFGIDSGKNLYWPALMPMLICGGLLISEAIPPAMRTYPVPSPNPLPLWVMWLRDRAEPNSAVACLPFPRGDQVGDYEEATVWMYWGTYHKHPLLNGYSGFFPDSYIKMKEGLELSSQRDANSEPKEFIPKFSDYDDSNLGLIKLNESGARYAVMKRAFGNRDDVSTNEQTRSRWSFVFSDEASQIDIYQISVLDD